MSTIIRLDLVLREAVDTPYRDLVTRPTGVAVRDRVLTVLRDAAGCDAELDFSMVGLMDFSCADEVIAKLLVQTLGFPVQRVTLRGVSEDHVDAIEQVLARYEGLVIVAILTVSGEARLLGAAPEDWHAAFGALTQLGRAPAAPIADALSWPVPRTIDALQGLARQRCVVAHPDATFEFGAAA